MTIIKFTTPEFQRFRQSLPEYRRDETFYVLFTKYDVVRAQYIIQRQPEYASTIIVDVQTTATMLGMTPYVPPAQRTDPTVWYNVCPLGPVDPESAFEDRINLTRPLICGMVTDPHGNTHQWLLDGYHRLYKAFNTGVPTLRTNVLTEFHTKICRS
jgi:hypothetical protein